MNQHEPLIELGEVLDDVPAEDGRAAAPHPFRRRHAAGALLAVLVLVGMSASLPLPAPSLVETAVLPTSATARVLLLGDLVVVTDRGLHTAYSAVDGGQRWAIPALDGADGPQVYFAVLADDVLLAAPMTEDRRLIFLDPADGTQRWTTDSLSYVGRDVAVETREHGRESGLPRKDGEPHDLVVRDLRSGKVRWSAPGTGGVSAVDDEAGLLVTIGDDGGYTARDLATGQVRRTARLTLPQGLLQNARLLAGRLVVTMLRLTDTPQGEGFEQEVWLDSGTLAPMPSTSARAYSSQDCGPAWCVFVLDAPDGRQAYYDVVAKDTGALVLRTGPLETAEPYGFGVLVTSGEPTSFGRVALRVADVRTGATILDLRGWTALEPLGTEPSHLLLRPVLLGSDPRHPGAGVRTYLATATPDGVRQIGALPYQMVECFSDSRTLACRMIDGRVGIWRVDP